MLLVGDAAGQVKPFSGGGIYTSLVAAQARRGDDRGRASRQATSRRAALSAYEKRWKREIGRELRGVVARPALWAGAERRARWSAWCGRCGARGCSRSRRVTADIDYPSQVLLRLARSAPALATLAWVTVRDAGGDVNLVRAHLPFAV